MILYFDITKIPRSTTRQEWREMWRWKREVEKKLKEELGRKISILQTVTDLPSRVRENLMNEMIYPPLLLGPYN